MSYGRKAHIHNKQAEFIFNDMPKDLYYIFVFHDENGNGQYEQSEDGRPLEGIAVSNASNGLTGFATFETNYIALDKDYMEEELKIFYYE